MGYYTRYKFTVLDLKGSKGEKHLGSLIAYEKLLEDARRFNSLDQEDLENYKPEYVARLKSSAARLAKVPADVFDNIRCDDAFKWYEHEEQMKALSKAFPEFIFQLEGEGEESGDIWVKWFHNGKMQGGKAQVVLPTLDIKALVK